MLIAYMCFFYNFKNAGFLLAGVYRLLLSSAFHREQHFEVLGLVSFCVSARTRVCVYLWNTDREKAEPAANYGWSILWQNQLTKLFS